MVRLVRKEWPHEQQSLGLGGVLAGVQPIYLLFSQSVHETLPD